MGPPNCIGIGPRAVRHHQYRSDVLRPRFWPPSAVALAKECQMISGRHIRQRSGLSRIELWFLLITIPWSQSGYCAPRSLDTLTLSHRDAMALRQGPDTAATWEACGGMGCPVWLSRPGFADVLGEGVSCFRRTAAGLVLRLISYSAPPSPNDTGSSAGPHQGPSWRLTGLVAVKHDPSG
jgi:hypothetical protein